MAAETNPSTRRRIVGVSTKMYFTAVRTNSFVDAFLAKLASDPTSSPAILDTIDVFIIPDHVTLAGVISKVHAAAPSKSNLSFQRCGRVLVGAQDCHSQAAGAFTGEVSPAVLAEVGCDMVELGHAERRRLFGETDETAAAKAAAVAACGMVPLVCVGEVTAPAAAGSAEELQRAVDEVMVQVRSVLAAVPDKEGGEVVLAYEPVWAIGASEPAPVEHVVKVVGRIRESEEVKGRKGVVRIVYGGSAGPGLFERLKGAVDGLFLGRFAHDPEQFYKTVCEVARA